jgi:hypothetical protein
VVVICADILRPPRPVVNLSNFLENQPSGARQNSSPSPPHERANSSANGAPQQQPRATPWEHMIPPYPAPTARPNNNPGQRPGKPETPFNQALKGRPNPGPNLARLNVHFIFTTKNRTRLLPDTIRPSLHAYMATVLQISAERHVWD